MSINNITSQSYTSNAPVDFKTDLKQVGQDKESTTIDKDQAAEYIPAKDEKKATYSKPDIETIERLKEETNRNYQHLRQMVRQLLEKQGMTFKDLEGFDGEIPVDEETRVKAREAIGEGGPLSPENTSDRIVDFAKAISGGDTSKLKVLRGAIEKGFEEAAKAFGGELPEVSNKTYTLIMDKLDAWEKDAG